MTALITLITDSVFSNSFQNTSYRYKEYLGSNSWKCNKKMFDKVSQIYKNLTKTCNIKGRQWSFPHLKLVCRNCKAICFTESKKSSFQRKCKMKEIRVFFADINKGKEKLARHIHTTRMPTITHTNTLTMPTYTRHVIIILVFSNTF